MTDAAKPTYEPDFAARWGGPDQLARLLAELPWEQRTDARQECMMRCGPQHNALPPLQYTYGSGMQARTYTSQKADRLVLYLADELVVQHLGKFNVCFLNRYDDQHRQLGWHADDSPTMSHDHPIAVVSFGAARELWWRPLGQTGVVPKEQRVLLHDGSLLLMPAGFQRTHQHRIPKCDHPCQPRVSFTYRHYLEVV